MCIPTSAITSKGRFGNCQHGFVRQFGTVKGKGTGQEPSRDEILSGTGTEILILARKNCGTGTEIQILARDKSGTGTDRNIDCPALFNH